jgi:hypothetical protein
MELAAEAIGTTIAQATARMIVAIRAFMVDSIAAPTHPSDAPVES